MAVFVAVFVNEPTPGLATTGDDDTPLTEFCSVASCAWVSPLRNNKVSMCGHEVVWSRFLVRMSAGFCFESMKWKRRMLEATASLTR